MAIEKIAKNGKSTLYEKQPSFRAGKNPTQSTMVVTNVTMKILCLLRENKLQYKKTKINPPKMSFLLANTTLFFFIFIARILKKGVFRGLFRAIS